MPGQRWDAFDILGRADLRGKRKMQYECHINPCLVRVAAISAEKIKTLEVFSKQSNLIFMMYFQPVELFFQLFAKPKGGYELLSSMNEKLPRPNAIVAERII